MAVVHCHHHHHGDWWLWTPSKNLVNYCKMSVQMVGKPSQWVSHNHTTILYYIHHTFISVYNILYSVYSLGLRSYKNWCRSWTCPTAGKRLGYLCARICGQQGKLNFCREFLQENRNMSDSGPVYLTLPSSNAVTQHGSVRLSASWE